MARGDSSDLPGVPDRPQSQFGLPAARPSDLDRERALTLLQNACIDDRITLDELGQRVEIIEKATTSAELWAATADLVRVPAHRAPLSTSTTAIMSEVSRVGRWRVAERLSANMLMGKCKLDLRHAAISSPVTTIVARVLMGELEVIVPPGIDVELDTMVVMGNRSLRGQESVAPAGAPLVRIAGIAVMGAVNVRVAE